jgi:predicted RNA-binding Zn-ribbon protein involved in translation (DUF1610 family)
MKTEKPYSITLDTSSRKFICPNCGKKSLVRYLENGQYMADHLGRCDREDKCGYFEKPAGSSSPVKKEPIHQPPPEPDFIPREYFERNQLSSQQNNLHAFFCNQFGEDMATELQAQYRYGTASKSPYDGACIFWQFDVNDKIRSGKIIQYNPKNGKRDKNINPFWAHKMLPSPSFQLVQCFFGEHLIAGSTGPIAIVESEKTAMIASIYFPEFTWLATGGKQGCKWTDYQVARVLHNRSVVLFPDLGANPTTGETCYQYWSKRAAILNGYGLSVSVSDILENNPEITDQDREDGLDLADFLLQFDYRTFNDSEGSVGIPTDLVTASPEINSAYQPTDIDKVYKLLINLNGEYKLPERWNDDERKKFIDIVKEFIRYDNGRPFGFIIEFKSDYSALRKISCKIATK